jgi:uncharacterized protein YjgD (DUF1641 family)
MIETLVKPVPLDNDIAVMKILHLMGQLSPKDMQHVLTIAMQVYKVVRKEEPVDSSYA